MMSGVQVTRIKGVCRKGQRNKRKRGKKRSKEMVTHCKKNLTGRTLRKKGLKRQMVIKRSAVTG